MSNYNIGNRIKALRTEYKVSQEQLALKASITPAYLGQIERNERNPTIKIIEQVATIFGLTLSAFFADSSEQTQDKTASGIYQTQLFLETQTLSDREQQEILEIIQQIIRFKQQ